MGTAQAFTLRAVGADDWPVVRWLWQAYRSDLALVVNGLPYSDGRYQARRVDRLPGPDTVGYLAWQPHPNTGEEAPVAFALVEGVNGHTRSIGAFWVAPVVRRSRIGHRLALDIINRHPPPWTITFQHDNAAAGKFWRRVADDAFGIDRWTEEQLSVPDRPDAPPDHWIRS